MASNYEERISQQLPKVSVVFVTFNRIDTLRVALQSFLENTDYPREKFQLIAADDGSDTEILRQMRDLCFDEIVTGPRMSGLPANVNRGLARAEHELVLQIQDDWQCVGPPKYLIRAVRALEFDRGLGMVMLNNHPSLTNFESSKHMDQDQVLVHTNQPNVKIRKVGEHAYSDWPHIKTKEFIEKIGSYNEKKPMWSAELDYSRRVNSQRRYFIAQIKGLNAFVHIGQECSFNTGGFRRKISRNIRSIIGRS